MKLPHLLALAVLIATPALRAEPRVFTNTEGRSVKAELVALEDDKTVVMRLANRKIARVPIDTLSANDQSHVRKWWADHKDKLNPMDFVLKINRKTDVVDRETTRSGGHGGGNNRNNNQQFAPETKRTRVDDYQYVCELKNYLPRDLEDIEVEYTIYKRVSSRDKNGGDSDTEEIDGSTTIRHLKALGTATFETEIVTCEDKSKTGGRGPREWHRESIRGVVFKLSKGGRTFLEQSDPETLLDQLEREENR
jgi:hypothetical protein